MWIIDIQEHIIVQGMMLRDQQPCSLDGTQAILEDPSRREIVVKALQEALAAFGYKDTLKSLEAESKITYQKQKTANIQALLHDFDYEPARQQLKLFDLPPSEEDKLTQIIDELLITRLMSEGDVDRALNFITSTNIRQDLKGKYYALIALQNLTISSQKVQEQHRFIIQTCKSHSSQQKNMKNLLNAYLLQNSVSAKSKNNAPKRVIAQSEGGLSLAGIPHFIKFNWSAQRLIVVSQAKQEYEVSLWAIDGQRVRKICRVKERSKGEVVGVEWSIREVSRGELVGVCSYEELVVLAAADLSVTYRISIDVFKLPKFLTFAWNPISEVIYVGGLFSKLVGFDASGEFVTELCPFMTCRKIVFSPKGELFAITATAKGRVLKFNLQTQTVQADFMKESLFMDLKWHSQRLLVTNKDFIFILSATTLEPIYTCDAPSNPKLITIQAYFYGDWLIVFNQKVRGTLQGSNFVTQTKWDDCDAIDVHQKAMVSIGSSIKIWSEDDDETAEMVSYVPNGGFECDSSSEESSSQSSSSSQQEEPSESEDHQQLQAYRQLMEIQFMNNLDPHDSSE